jgi:Arc/MetJ-type ribon-helix-helix transcriptional regulator
VKSSEKKTRTGFLGELTKLIQDIRVSVRQGSNPISKPSPQKVAQRKSAALKGLKVPLSKSSSSDAIKEALKNDLNSRERRKVKRASERRLNLRIAEIDRVHKMGNREGPLEKPKGKSVPKLRRWGESAMIHPWAGRSNIQHVAREGTLEDIYHAHPILLDTRFGQVAKLDRDRKCRKDAYSFKSYTPSGVVRRDYNIASKGLRNDGNIEKRASAYGVVPKGTKSSPRRTGKEGSTGTSGGKGVSKRPSKIRRSESRLKKRADFLLAKAHLIKAKQPVLPKPPRGEGVVKAKGVMAILSRKKREVLTKEIRRHMYDGLKELATVDDGDGKLQFERIAARITGEIFQVS